ncbi:hypothetical protein AAKU55_005366 [Oxalobacteraceae bacterium GrIS 1.11]
MQMRNECPNALDERRLIVSLIANIDNSVFYDSTIKTQDSRFDYISICRVGSGRQKVSKTSRHRQLKVRASRSIARTKIQTLALAPNWCKSDMTG